MSEEKYFDKSRIVIRQIEKGLAENMIVKNHYSHKWSLCQVAYGIFYISDVDSEFFDSKEEKHIGSIVFGQPVGRSAAESISDLVKVDEVFELTRLWVADGYGRNIESYCLSEALKLIRRDFLHIRALITYADSEVGHRGVIYQASNMYYQGRGEIALMPNYSISLVGPPYKWIHSRTVSATYGSHNVEHLKKKIGHTFWRKKESSKHRYFYLFGNKMEKKKILSNLKHPILPYPKLSDHQNEVEKIICENNDNFSNNFFSFS